MLQGQQIPEFSGRLRNHMIRVPEVIGQCSGIRVFGKTIKSIAFTTDVAILQNIDADAAIAVYPFTPQTLISRALIQAASIPVFVGVGGGVTAGARVLNIANDAEHEGAFGVVVNAPTSDETIFSLKRILDIPVIVTVVSLNTDIAKRLASGADILNVAGAAQTPEIVRKIRSLNPTVPIIATGGQSDESILRTIDAGANAITYTPPTCAQLFAQSMAEYRLRENEQQSAGEQSE